ncbi:FAD binding domain-containing protein [Paracoccus aminovorans]|uniref:FAD binding domain-containing protein n=1 Tax=Paracoccus aminovorans TaxID=34004 RepID=UPI002B260A53|nr:xanthine dehydrogenase family protein subunit M [Paracoccus aminovorans]
MKQFHFMRAHDAAQAIGTDARLIAGGTNLLDLMKHQVETPDHLLDINHIGLESIGRDGDGLWIGALVRNADLAGDARVRDDYPLLSLAILCGASPQIRNRATTGGNMMQRTRCYYFYDTSSPCNKREPGSGCPAIGGCNRTHAIFGTSDQCIATYPGDMAVAMTALDATVHIEGPDGSRQVPAGEFHRLPGTTPQRDTVLEPGEIISAVTLPPPLGGRQIYRKVRDRRSYAFALVSVAVVLRIEDGRIATARIAAGGVAPRPWRVKAAEDALTGQPAGDQAFSAAIDAFMQGATGQGQNDFKVPLLRRTLRAVLHEAAGDSAMQEKVA